jgi:hypothetical protein
VSILVRTIQPAALDAIIAGGDVYPARGCPHRWIGVTIARCAQTLVTNPMGPLFLTTGLAVCVAGAGVQQPDGAGGRPGVLHQPADQPHRGVLCSTAREPQVASWRLCGGCRHIELPSILTCKLRFFTRVAESQQW